TRTPLYYAAQHDKEAIVALLIKYGADTNVKDTDGNPLVHTFLWEKNTKAMEHLLANGVNPETLDRYGRTLLHVAALRVNTHAIAILLKYGADPYAKNSRGETPLTSLQQTIKKRTGTSDELMSQYNQIIMLLKNAMHHKKAK
ncbi:MAG: ankyrin repeat domain-containing protein, partial [Rickettsiales bacterium]|nr:ankyrin repeat domain-containing protein [Rickettsiales bacterium]